MGLKLSTPGFDLFAYPNRVDLSVNNARVNEAYSATPTLKCATSGNVVGGFNGGGLGNKSILGFDVLDGMGLATLSSLTWTYTNLSPYIPNFWTKPYANLVLQLNPLVATYNIAVIDPQVLGLAMGGETSNPDGSKTWTWLAPTDAMLIVGSPVSFPIQIAPPVPPPPVISFGAGAYPAASYTIASLLAAYPGAIFKKVSTLDGGLPKTTVTPAFMLVEGDSGNNTNINMLLGDVLLNGVNI